MRTRLIVPAVVMGLLGAVLVAGPVSGGVIDGPPNCEVPIEAGTATPSGPASEPGSCAELQITKVVTGSAPAGTTFAVLVACEEASQNGETQALPPSDGPPVDKTLYLAAGETQTVFLDEQTTCTVSETPPPGCTLVSIDPPTVVVDKFVVYPVTVTNDCPEPEAEPEAEAEAEPAAAEVVAAEPTFTG
jgi:hypothetical protein